MKISRLEAVFSRGDRRLSEAIREAYSRGCRFDSWDEHFRPDVWDKVFADLGIDPAFYANREREMDEALPWGHIDMLVTPSYLAGEMKKAQEAALTQDCRLGCNGCFGGAHADLCKIS